MSKKVGIIVPCYNVRKYIPSFLESILAQTYRDIELIMINDGSIDGTEDAINNYRERLQESGIDLTIGKQENKGVAETINLGLSYLNNEYVMWMDPDDILLPNAIEKKVAFLERHPDCDLVLCKGYAVNEGDLDKPISVIEWHKEGKGCLFRDLLLEKAFRTNIGYFVRTSSLWRAIPKKHICGSREGQNFQLLLPLAYSGRYGFIDEVLYKYVIHSDSHSHFKRSYDDLIRRENNILTLLTATISSIPNMSDNEKQKWIQVAAQHRLYVKMLTAEDYYKKKEYKKYFRELKKEGVKIPFKDRYFSHFCHHAASYLKRKILRRKAGA